MTILEQRFYETVPTRLKEIETELKKLNQNFSILFSNQRDGEGKPRRADSHISDILSDSLLPDVSVKDAELAAELLRPNLQNLNHEEMWVLFLNGEGKPLRKEMICKGNISSTLTDCRRIVSKAIDCRATAVIAFHNHPSGNVEPSSCDIKVTNDLRASLKVFDIDLLDHIIIGEKKFYSFAAEETINFKSNI